MIVSFRRFVVRSIPPRGVAGTGEGAWAEAAAVMGRSWSRLHKRGFSIRCLLFVFTVGGGSFVIGWTVAVFAMPYWHAVAGCLLIALLPLPRLARMLR